mmetsp:Transcript_59738/g.110561  ORF Transcript_59738/g.110561 Transcript_59738/m.110561 type:complete len:412 (+) Transcript_59738:79-1314(+)
MRLAQSLCCRSIALPIWLLLSSKLARPAGAQGLMGGNMDLTPLRPVMWSEDLDRAACELPAASGVMSGVCTDNATVLQEKISFCADVVPYRACIPADQPLWGTWSATKKDMLLSKLFKRMIDKRMAREMNVTPDVYVEVKFLSNPECVSALKRALCWYNFPKCSFDNRSLPLCESSCEAYYRACRYEPDAGESFLSCLPERNSDTGLFNTNTSGPDQALAAAENGTECEGIEDRHFDIDGDDGPWYRTTWGTIVIILSALLLQYVMFYFIVPLEAQDQMWALFIYWVTHPYRVIKRFPHFSSKTTTGRVLILIVTFVGIVLFVTLLYKSLETGGWLNKWGSDTKDAIEEPFDPKRDVWTIDTRRSLTQRQLKQLHYSCTCTGFAAHGCCPPGVAQVLPFLAVTALAVQVRD